jgi:hypothetical protein
MAALGTQAAGSTALASGAAAAFFAAGAMLAWWLEPGPERLVKFPMDPAYALLSCAAIEAAFFLAHPLKRLGPIARRARWLGRNWLIYFYLHFAIALALGRLRPGPAPVVWTLLAAGSIAATWVAARAAAPLARVFQWPAAWLVPLALNLLAGGLPGLAPVAVSALAGVAGLIFAAYHDTLAYVIVNLPSSGHGPSLVPGFGSSSRRAGPSRPAGPNPRARVQSPGEQRRPAEGPGAVAGGPGHGLARVALVFTLLVVPEAVGWLTGTKTSPVLAPPRVPPDRDRGLRQRPSPEAPRRVAPSGSDEPRKSNASRPESDRPFNVTYTPDRVW